MGERTTSSTGVYKIRNTLNNKCYIGSTSENFTKRWRLHLRSLRIGKHHSILLQRAWDKHGESSFVFEVIENVSPESCLEREQHFLDNEQPQYNICKIAGSPIGRKSSDVTRQKIREKMLGEKNPFFGKHHTTDSIRKMSEAQIGRSYSHLIGENNPIHSHPHTDELRQLMSDSSKQFWNSDRGSRLKADRSVRMTGKPNPNRVLRGSDHPRYNGTVHVFRNLKTNETFSGTACEFIKKYKLTSEAYYLANGKYKKHKGWILS